MSDPEVAVIPTPGLGNSTYLMAVDGRAVAIDVPRDAWRIHDVAEARGWRITHVLETHVHNDYLSGALELAASQRATIVAPADGGYDFGHQPAREGFELDLGNGGLVARATPGHTPEHLSWELQDGNGRPTTLFSGGSLLIGGVGRTDLLGHARLDEMTAAQYRTHAPSGRAPRRGRGAADPRCRLVLRRRRRGHQRRRHHRGAAALEPRLRGSGPAPRSRRSWPPAARCTRSTTGAWHRLNRRGPRLLGGPPIAHAMTTQEFADARAAGAWVLDARDRWAFAELHVQGSWNIEAGDAFAAYAGWLLPFDAPLCLVVDSPEQEVEVREELLAHRLRPRAGPPRGWHGRLAGGRR